MSNKNHYLIRVSYDGSSYYGSQAQVSLPTIEKVLRDTLQGYFKMKIPVTISSRTDRGVHAIDHPMLIKIPLEVDVAKTMRNLNWNLPSDVQIWEMVKVDPKFHPRYLSKEKTYRYRITNKIDPFNARYVTYYRNEIDVEKLHDIIDIIVGEHNFINFTSKNPREDYVRHVTNIKIERDGNEVVFFVSGKGFLRFMVRNIIACFLEYNEDKLSVEDIKKIIENEMTHNFKRAEPNGLCLYKVEF